MNEREREEEELEEVVRDTTFRGGGAINSMKFI
jgi:hypothetical protein